MNDIRDEPAVKYWTLKREFWTRGLLERERGKSLAQKVAEMQFHPAASNTAKRYLAEGGREDVELVDIDRPTGWRLSAWGAWSVWRPIGFMSNAAPLYKFDSLRAARQCFSELTGWMAKSDDERRHTDV